MTVNLCVYCIVSKRCNRLKLPFNFSRLRNFTDSVNYFHKARRSDLASRLVGYTCIATIDCTHVTAYNWTWRSDRRLPGCGCGSRSHNAAVILCLNQSLQYSVKLTLPCTENSASLDHQPLLITRRHWTSASNSPKVFVSVRFSLARRSGTVSWLSVIAIQSDQDDNMETHHQLWCRSSQVTKRGQRQRCRYLFCSVY